VRPTVDAGRRAKRWRFASVMLAIAVTLATLWLVGGDEACVVDALSWIQCAVLAVLAAAVVVISYWLNRKQLTATSIVVLIMGLLAVAMLAIAASVMAHFPR